MAGRQSKAAATVRFSHVEKVMFPAKGYTKGDMLEYYLKVADVMVPHLKDRPVTVERLPDGVKEGAPRFWQKRTPEYYPEFIQRVKLPSGSGEDVEYAVINDAQALLYFVNQGAITFHIHFSRIKSLKRPDFLLFDLDPGGAKFANVVKIALRVRNVLKAQKADAFIKTSGKSGLHIVTPWNRKEDFDEAREWAMEVASEVVRDLPSIATTERSIVARKGRVYVDVMQNAMGKHAVAPYTLRATDLATASTPLEWKEVKAGLDPRKFDLKTVVARVKKRGDLWDGLAS